MKLFAKKKPINLIAETVISLLLVVSGVLLCLSCYSIYRSADTQMFTYEKIGEAFSKIALPIYITLAATVAGILLVCVQRLSCGDDEKPKAHRSLSATARTLSERIDESVILQEQKEALAKERGLRRILKAINLALCALCAVVPLIFIVNPDLYLGTTSAECTAEVLRSMLFYITCLLPSAVFALVYTFLCDSSYKREISLLKEIVKNNTNPSPAKPDKVCVRSHKLLTLCIQLSIFAVAIVFIIAGISNGGMQDVWKKAAEICAECIGLG